MISLANATIDLGNGDHLIEEWQVWFQTPFGIIPKLEDATKRCKEADLDPDYTIVPVCVAVSGKDYEVYPRR